MKTTADKAIGGAVTANIVVFVNYLVSQIPWVQTLPDEPSAALYGLLNSAIGYGIVWAWKANQPVLSSDPPHLTP